LSNVIRGDQLGSTEDVVHIPLQAGIFPIRHQEGEKKRLDIHERLIHEARIKEHEAKESAKILVENANKEAEKILSNTKEKASAILAGATKERERIEEAARESGMSRAREDAKAEAVSSIESALKILEETALNLKKTKSDYIESAIDGMVDVISSALKGILRTEIVLDNAAVKRTISSALSEIIGADRIKIKINPEDLSSSEEMRDEIMNKVKGLSSIEIEEDKGITRGGALIETSFGRVDARVETQIEEMLRDMRIAVENIPAEVNEEISDS